MNQQVHIDSGSKFAIGIQWDDSIHTHSINLLPALHNSEIKLIILQLLVLKNGLSSPPI